MNEKTKQGVFAVVALAGLVLIMMIAWASRDSSASRGSHQIDQVRPGGVLPK